MKKKVTRHSLILIFLALLLFTLFFVLPRLFGSVSYKQGEQMVQEKQEKKQNSGAVVVFPPLDKVAYDTKMVEKTTVVVPAKPAPAYPWPVKAVYPNAGAILPFNRIIAYYGNLYSKKM